MCFPHQLGGNFVRDARNVRTEYHPQAQTQDMGQTYRQQDNFDALHCHPVEDIPPFRPYDGQRQAYSAKSAFPSTNFAGAPQKDIAIAGDFIDRKNVRRDSLENYDPLMWMKQDREIDSETHDEDPIQARNYSSVPVKTEIPLHLAKSVNKSAVNVLKKSKWRRRDIGKHLEGEKRRRKARMNRLFILRDMLPKRSSKSTVNGILMDAIEYLKGAVSAEQRTAMKKIANTSVQQIQSQSQSQMSANKDVPHATLKRGVEPVMVRTGILSSNLFPSLLLDQHGNIVESSASLTNLVGYPCVLNDMPFMAMLHPDDANDLAQRVTIFQSWLTPADLITSNADPLSGPLRCTVRLTNYSGGGVHTIPVDIELLPIVRGNVAMMLVIILNQPSR